MSKGVVPPSPIQSIVDDRGKMLEVFRVWTQLMSKAVPLVGNGSPEDVVTADKGQLYMDEAGSTGTILYIKKSADIAGDRKKGWILV